MTIFSFYMSVQPGIESLPMSEPTAGWSRWPRHYLWPAHIKMMLATLDCLPLAVTIFTTSTSVSFKQLCTGGMSIVVNAEGWGEEGEIHWPPTRRGETRWSCLQLSRLWAWNQPFPLNPTKAVLILSSHGKSCQRSRVFSGLRQETVVTIVTLSLGSSL